jgi:hypothetical protein
LLNFELTRDSAFHSIVRVSTSAVIKDLAGFILRVQSPFFVFMQYFDLGIRMTTISLGAGIVDLYKTLKVTLVQVR